MGEILDNKYIFLGLLIGSHCVFHVLALFNNIDTGRRNLLKNPSNFYRVMQTSLLNTSSSSTIQIDELYNGLTSLNGSCMAAQNKVDVLLSRNGLTIQIYGDLSAKVDALQNRLGSNNYNFATACPNTPQYLAEFEIIKNVIKNKTAEIDNIRDRYDTLYQKLIDQVQIVRDSQQTGVNLEDLETKVNLLLSKVQNETVSKEIEELKDGHKQLSFRLQQQYDNIKEIIQQVYDLSNRQDSNIERTGLFIEEEKLQRQVQTLLLEYEKIDKAYVIIHEFQSSIMQIEALNKKNEELKKITDMLEQKLKEIGPNSINSLDIIDKQLILLQTTKSHEQILKELQIKIIEVKENFQSYYGLNQKLEKQQSVLEELQNIILKNAAELKKLEHISEIVEKQDIALRELKVKINNVNEMDERYKELLSVVNKQDSIIDTLVTKTTYMEDIHQRNVDLILKIEKQIAKIEHFEESTELEEITKSFKQLQKVVKEQTDVFETVEEETKQIIKLERSDPDKQSKLTEHTQTISRLKLMIAELKQTCETGPALRTKLKKIAKNCVEAGQRNGIYTVQIANGRPFNVVCDFDYYEGGWLVVAKREVGNVDFYRNWADYRDGFGNLNGDHFVGLQHLYAITSSEQQELLVYLEDFEGGKAFARYDNFAISDESDDFRLISLGKYSGNAGNSLKYHLGAQFSTRDRHSSIRKNNCAETFHSAWWFKDCSESDLFAPLTSTSKGQGIEWHGFRGCNYSLKYAEMLIRPKVTVTEVKN